MEKIVLKKVHHKGKDWIGIVGANEKHFNEWVRKLNAVWTRTWKCWLLPYTKENYKRLTDCSAGVYTVELEKQGMKNLPGPPKIQKKTNPGIPVSQTWAQDQEGLTLWEMRQEI